AENKLGADGVGGIMGVVSTLEATRVMVGAGALGIARAAFETTLQYAKTRVQKKPILEFQAVGHKLADMETHIQAARALTWKAAWMATEGVPFNRAEGSQAKLYAGEVAVQACLDAIQIHGGYGFMKEYDVGRWLLDAIIYRIWEGTSEIQKNTILRALAQGESE
ncbi:MAG TPA: acyl-CoA dehydrogenase family protein, partial [Planctomycetota bacterium]|nr:acyl-CoA dehydrogenase family protein [Planctomycetota bacterium]